MSERKGGRLPRAAELTSVFTPNPALESMFQRLARDAARARAELTRAIGPRRSLPGQDLIPTALRQELAGARFGFETDELRQLRAGNRSGAESNEFHRVPARVRAAIENDENLQLAIARARKAWKPGGFHYDILALFSETRPSEERAASAQRLAANHFARPIAPQRWGPYQARILAELRSRAKRHGTTPEAELRDCIASSLFLAASRLGHTTPDEVHVEFRRSLNNLVMEALLGEGWDRDDCTIPLDDPPGDGADTELQDGLEAALTIVALTKAAGLSARDAELVAARYQGESLASAAERLGMAESAARMAYKRAKKRVQSAM